jgi:hypothetical protein
MGADETVGEEGVEKKPVIVYPDEIMEIISKNSGIPLEEIQRVFTAFENEFPKIVGAYSPSAVGDSTYFAIPHFTLKVECDYAENNESSDDDTGVRSRICPSASLLLLIAANKKLAENGTMAGDLGALFLSTLDRHSKIYKESPA